MRSPRSPSSGSRHRARMVLTLAAGGDRPRRGAGRGGGRAPAPGHAGARRHRRPLAASPPRADPARRARDCRSRSGPPTRVYAEALHLADAVSPAGGLALGGALRRIADSQVLEALGVTTARYWDVVDGKTVSLFDASFALADEAAGGSLPDRRARRGPPRTGACSSTSTTCTTSAARPTPWGSRPGSTPTTSCRRCPPPTSSCPTDEVRRAPAEPRRPGRATRVAGVAVGRLLRRCHRPAARRRGAGARRRDAGTAMSPARLPRHVAVIMDGNGRWAERQGLARTVGHSQGEERLAEIVRAADATRHRVAHRLRVLHRELAPPPARGRLHPRTAQEDLRPARRDARQQREDPLDRARQPRRLADPGHRAARDREVDPPHRRQHRPQLHRRVRLRRSTGAGRSRAGHRPPSSPTRSTNTPSAATSTSPSFPPVDLMIRTSGEARISNFLLWEGVGAQLYVTPTLWPDFGAVRARAGHRLVAAQRGRQRT